MGSGPIFVRVDGNGQPSRQIEQQRMVNRLQRRIIRLADRRPDLPARDRRDLLDHDLGRALEARCRRSGDLDAADAAARRGAGDQADDHAVVGIRIDLPALDHQRRPTHGLTRLAGPYGVRHLFRSVWPPYSWSVASRII